eukprot:9151333-Pyramimonas_sp.AAC.1
MAPAMGAALDALGSMGAAMDAGLEALMAAGLPEVSRRAKCARSDGARGPNLRRAPRRATRGGFGAAPE